MTPEITIPTIGTRLKHNEYLGTVRYVGPVDGTQGEWIGVEWDVPSRGKHSGTKDGKQYFTCIIPGSGSFIRTSATIFYGVSFLTALIAKYNELPRGSSLEKVVLGSSNGAIEVEAPGLDKVRNNLSRLERLREASLDGEGVASADPSGSIRSTCPGIRGLDLSKNLLSSWKVITEISCELPNLQRLALNNNRLQPLEDMSLVAKAFGKLSELQLNATLTTWDQLRSILAFIPSVQLVEMGYNRLYSLGSETSGVDEQALLLVSDKLEVLNLDGNELHNWAAICTSLRACTGLQRLVLTLNGIASIGEFASSSQSPVECLKHVSLSNNLISKWSDIDNLARWCPELQTLMLSDNPLLEDTVTGRYARQFIIAKIPSLLVLDAAPISAKARTDSELFYLSYIAQHESADEKTIRINHPQWTALCAKHGIPDGMNNATTRANQDTLAGQLIELHVYRIAGTPNGDSPSQEPAVGDKMSLSVLPAMPVRVFRLKVGKTFKIPKSQQSSLRIWLRMPNGHLAELDGNDNRDLAWWGVENGSDIMFGIGA